MGLKEISTTGYDGHITDIIQQLVVKCPRDTFALILLVCWNLWNRRKRWVWDKVNVSEFGVQAMVMNMLHEWKKKRAESRSHRGVTNGISTRWHRPQHGWLKVNTDVAVFMEWIGYVIRNECGQFVRERNQKMQALYSPREAEALGLKEALSWVKTLRLVGDYSVSLVYISFHSQIFQPFTCSFFLLFIDPLVRLWALGFYPLSGLGPNILSPPTVRAHL